MKKSYIIEALVLALAIFGGAAFFANALVSVKDRERSVLVRGLAEREVSADYVIWPIEFKELGNDLTALYASAQKKRDLLVKFLGENGIAPEEISFASPSVFDADAEAYLERKPANRYKLTMVVTVASPKVEVVRALMGKQMELVGSGLVFADGDYRNAQVFSYNALNEIKPAMIEEATKNARLAGEKFAKDSQSKLGKIKSASQGVFTITDRDQNSPHIKKIRVVTNLEYFLED